MTIPYGTAKKLIGDILFAAIITVGLQKFFDEFYSQHKRFFLDPNLHFISNVPALLNVISFLTIFFWAIAQWLVYNKEDKESEGSIKVGILVIHIILFSLTFIILNISIMAYDLTILFVLAIITWHLSNLGLQVAKKRFHICSKDVDTFIIREVIYTMVFFCLYGILYFGVIFHSIILFLTLIAVNVNSFHYAVSLKNS